MRNLITGQILLFLSACVTVLVPLPVLAFTDNPVVSAWMPVSWDTEEARASFRDHRDIFDEISPFQYRLLDDGTIEHYANANDVSLINEAHDAGIRIIPTITNSFKGETVHAVLTDPAKRAALIQNLLQEVTSNNYDGIDIDFEGLLLEDKQRFTDFLRDVASELHRRNKLLTVAIQAQTEKTDPRSSARAQDWDAIGSIVDRFRIMTYDFHWQSSNAGSISPIAWIADVTAFAVQHVPPEKIIIGIPFYGYNWPCRPGTFNDCERAISAQFAQVQAWLTKYGVTPAWDSENQEPYFTYLLSDPYQDSPNTERVVYFQNGESIKAKLLSLVDKKVAGIAIWRLGNEDPENFTSIQSVMKTESVQQDFTDIPKEHWAYNYIMTLRNKGIVHGIDNSFFPDRTVSFAEALKMTLGARHLPLLKYAELPLHDVKKNDWPYWYIQTAITRGWIDAPETGNAEPTKPLTRSQAVTLIARALSLAPNGSDATFSDLDIDDYATPYINAVRSAGIIKGYDDGTFRPLQPITRAEFSKLLFLSSR